MAAKKNNKIARKDKIYHLTTLVAGEFTLQEVLDRLAEGAVNATGVTACSIRLLDDEAGDLKMRSSYGLSEEYRNKGNVSKNDPVIKAAFGGEAVILDDMRVDNRVRYQEAAAKEGLISQMTIEMKFREKAIGVLRLYSPEPGKFNQDNQALARTVASQCAAAITNARLYNQAVEGARMAQQMKLAAVIQRRMIPKKAPVVPGLDVAAAYIPCFELGGDFYDFMQLGDECISVAISDVMGKGLPAAVMMSSFRGQLRVYGEGGHQRHTMIDIVKRLNKNACRELRDGEFISLFYSLVDVENMKMTYCSCGHEPTMLIRDDEICELTKGGLVLGVKEDAAYEIDEFELKDGDILLYYTDGLTDAVSFDSEFWGRERLFDAAKKFSKGSARQMVENILAYRRRFVGLAKQLDDTSIVVVKVDRRSQPNFLDRSDS